MPDPYCRVPRCIPLLAVFQLVCATCAAQDDAADATLAELRTACLRATGNISSLEAHFTYEHSSTPGGRLYHWYRSGENFRHVEDMSDSESNALCHDGVLYFSLHVTDGECDQVQVNRDLDPIFEMNLVPEVLLGVDVLTTDLSLADLLGDPEATVVGQAMVDGVTCWHIRGPAFDSHYDTRNRVRVFLDPEKDCLPRRIVTHGDGAEFTDDGIEGWFMDIRIEEFQQVSDEQSGETRWFPTQVRVLQNHPNQISIRIRDLKINPQLDDGLFHPVVDGHSNLLDLTSEEGPRFLIAESSDEFERHLRDIARLVVRETTVIGTAFEDPTRGPYLETDETIVFVDGLDTWPESVVGQSVSATGTIRPFDVQDGDQVLPAQQLDLESWSLLVEIEADNR